VVVASRTRVLLGSIVAFTTFSSTPVSAHIGVLALSFESFFYGSVSTGSGVLVFMNVEMSRSSSHLVLLSSLAETVFLSRFSWRNGILAGAEVPVMLDFLSICLFNLSISHSLLVSLLLFPLINDMGRELKHKLS
jgi:hypothetical protein